MGRVQHGKGKFFCIIMLPIMKKNIIIFLFAIVAVALLVVYFIYRGNTTDNINTSVNSPAANVAPTVDLGQQEETYRREVSEIVKPFF